MYNRVLGLPLDYPVVSLFVAVGLSYYLFYSYYVAQHPRIVCSDKYLSFLLAHCPILSRQFCPTPWCFGGSMQTLFRSILQSEPHVQYEKEFVTLPDGGHVALDWVGQQLPANTPVVLFLPGITGCSKASYARHIMMQSVDLGYRGVVFNFRGNGGAELKTPRIYNAACSADLSMVIAHIKGKYPGVPIVGTGISLGAMILSNYLAKFGEDCGLAGGLAISVLWNVHRSMETLEEPFNLLFNRHIASRMKDFVIKYSHVFEGNLDLDQVYQAKTMREFDNAFTSIASGYPSHKEYYDDASISEKVDKIKVPLLCLNAADDPFSPGHSIPLDKAKQSSNVAIVLTRYGGHIGFMEGIVPAHANYMDALFRQYVDAIFRHGHQLA